MSGLGTLLFSELDLRRVFDARLKAMHEEIDNRYDANRLLNTSVDDLATYFTEKSLVTKA